MSDNERLRKEIQYLSVLIQKHKDGKVVPPSRKRPDTSKYTWSNKIGSKPLQSVKGQTSSQSTSHVTNSGRKRHLPATHSRYPAKQFLSGQPPTSTTMAQKTGVAFDSKFKWTKSTSIKPPTTPSSIATVSQAARISSSTTSNHNRLQNINISNSKYKYHKASSDGGLVTARIRGKDFSGGNKHLNAFAFRKTRHTMTRHWNMKSTSKYKRQSSMQWVSKKHKKNPYKLNRTATKSPNASFKRSNSFGATKLIRNRKPTVPTRKGQAKVSPTHITLSKAALERLLQRHSMTRKQMLANRAVAKSHETSRLMKQEKKRQHCLYYGRFGKCMRGDSCKFIHDPTRIAVCTRFLRGTCRDKNCSFSHKVEKEKIPVCLFFIRGKCTVPNCPYLHVYLGKDAPVCKRFASTGYCPDADKCKMQHIKCCPEFYETGRCTKMKPCDLPHFRINKPRAKKQTSQDEQKISQDSGTSSINHKDATIKVSDQPTTSAATSSCPDFLSLSVDRPEPINKPMKRETTLIKPRFGKLLPKSSSSQ